MAPGVEKDKSEPDVEKQAMQVEAPPKKEESNNTLFIILGIVAAVVVIAVVVVVANRQDDRRHPQKSKQVDRSCIGPSCLR